MRLVAIAALLLASDIAVGATSIIVDGYGSNRESSKQDAFRTAIEKVCGLEILSDREHVNSKTRNNKVQTYSQCRIVDYVVLDETVDSIRVKVIVESTKNNGFFVHSPDNIFTENLSDVFDNYSIERESGDDFIISAFRHYPYHAYNLKIYDYRIITDSRRDLFLQIPYQLTWNKNFVKHIDATLNLVGTRTGQGKMYVGRKRYLIDDLTRLDLIKNQMTGNKDFRLRVKALDKSANHMFTVCHSPRYIPNGIFFSAGVYSELTIFPRDKNTDSIYIKLSQSDKNIHAIYVDVVAAKDCKV